MKNVILIGTIFMAFTLTFAKKDRELTKLIKYNFYSERQMEFENSKKGMKSGIKRHSYNENFQSSFKVPERVAKDLYHFV